MFFTDDRLHFFKPLTSKYREQIAQCLGLLYQRQYSANADYGQSLRREQVVELFEEALARTKDAVFDDATEGSDEPRFKNHREHANAVLKAVIEAGWVERQVDTATFQSTYPFSRMGRIFAQALLDADHSHIRTRHRNTRNTLNALEAFAGRGDAYDLLDAFEYSERIITDFTDIITELEERKRELVKEVESQQLISKATDQFFDYMEKRFQPDISVRLSADSVEKYRDDISRVIYGLRRKSTEFKRTAEMRLRASIPSLCDESQSYLWYVLDTIELRMKNAADIMLPALRRALHGFTKRADIVIRQLSYLNSHQNDNFLDICQTLAALPPAQYQERLNNASNAMAVMKLGLIDPKQVRLIERKRKSPVDTSINEERDIDLGARTELMVQQLLDRAFVFNRQQLQTYICDAFKDKRKVSTRELPITNALDLLALAHVIEVGSVNNLDSDLRFHVEWQGKKDNFNEYYSSSDEFTIELVEATNLVETMND
ncbi:Wadjet anti-phage system protein JetA family protein [Marinagarivorans algicola]|uniref:Wadjet anti-phage system protein JetA family protein n=1 Tax=Marinagarivorans algicola TaxID=1513270 RepID=UPI0006B41165|nr:Wadjet anti-phage system protein JetA family protein [Marinagarivorans algicola]